MVRHSISALLVVGVAVSWLALPGCGKVSSGDANGRGDDGAGGADEGDDAGTGSGAAGSGATGSGAAASGGGAIGVGGSSSGGASSGGAVATGGATAAGGSANSGGLNTHLDPHVEERRSLAQATCSLGEKFSCLRLSGGNGTPEQAKARCVAMTESASFRRFGTSCWDEWVAHMECGSSAPDYCPCEFGDGEDAKNYCNVNPELNNFGVQCQETKQALDACEMTLDNVGTEKGTAGEYSWVVDPSGSCESRSTSFEGDVASRVVARCTGSPAGGQNCYCYANDHMVVDLVDTTLNGGAYNEWYAESCRDVATQMAAGKCTTQLDCCIRFPMINTDGDEVETCGCGSDPSRAGYASCEEFAAAARGRVVDKCAEWQVVTTFPIEPKRPD